MQTETTPLQHLRYLARGENHPCETREQETHTQIIMVLANGFLAIVDAIKSLAPIQGNSKS